MVYTQVDIFRLYYRSNKPTPPAPSPSWDVSTDEGLREAIVYVLSVGRKEWLRLWGLDGDVDGLVAKLGRDHLLKALDDFELTTAGQKRRRRDESQSSSTLDDDECSGCARAMPRVPILLGVSVTGSSELDDPLRGLRVIASIVGDMLVPSAFRSDGLNSRMQQQLSDVLAVTGGAVPPWCPAICTFLPSLLSDDVRELLFQATTFGEHSDQREFDVFRRLACCACPPLSKPHTPHTISPQRRSCCAEAQDGASQRTTRRALHVRPPL